MKKIKDTIQFESRHEIGFILSALDKYMHEHPEDTEVSAVRELTELLDAMRLSW